MRKAGAKDYKKIIQKNILKLQKNLYLLKVFADDIDKYDFQGNK